MRRIALMPGILVVAAVALLVTVQATAQSPKESDSSAKALADAVVRAKAVPLKVDKDRVSSDLNEKDPQASFLVGGQEVPSNYEVYHFDAAGGQLLKVDMDIFLSLGFSKKAISPLVFLVGPGGSQLPLALESFKQGKAGRLNAVWTFTPSQSGAFDLVVACDTRQAGQMIAISRLSMTINGQGGPPLSLPVTGADKGKYAVKVVSSR